VQNEDPTPAGVRAYARDKRAILSGFATLIAGASFAVGGWAHAKLWEQSSRLSVIETQQTNDGRRQASAESRLDRIENKLDLILERLPR
jgi:hypothetical protein